MIRFILVICLTFFSLSFSVVAKPVLACSWVPEIKEQIAKLDKSLRASSDKYLVYNYSSEGWVMEIYIFVGKTEQNYKVVSLSNQSNVQKKDISKSEFDALLSHANQAVFDNRVKDSKTEHNHCAQYLLKNGDIEKDKIIRGLVADSRVRSLEKKLHTFIELSQ